MRPISGRSNPYDRVVPRRPVVIEGGGGGTSRAIARQVAAAADVSVAANRRASADVEIEVRMFADGGSISVQRRSVADADGTRRTIGIDAIIR